MPLSASDLPLEVLRAIRGCNQSMFDEKLGGDGATGRSPQLRYQSRIERSREGPRNLFCSVRDMM